MRYNAGGRVKITADDAVLTVVALQYDAFVKQETLDGKNGDSLLAPYDKADVGGDVMDTLLRYAGIENYNVDDLDEGIYLYIVMVSEWLTSTDATLFFLAKAGCGVKGEVYGEEEDAWAYATEMGDGVLKEERLVRITENRKRELETAWKYLTESDPEWKEKAESVTAQEL